MANGRVFGLLLLVSSVADPLHADAYVLRHTDSGVLVRWKRSDVSVRIDSALARTEGGRGGAAIAGAFETWASIAGNPFRIDVDRSGHDGMGEGSREDSQADVILQERGWQYAANYLAVTLVTYVPETGQIIDADILVNGVDHRFSVDPRGGPTYDLGNVITHEVGHLFGLGHSEVADATMFDTSMPGQTEKRSLEVDDEQGFAALYLGDDYGLAATSSSGCDAAGTRGRDSIAAVILSLLIAALMARPRTHRSR